MTVCLGARDARLLFRDVGVLRVIVGTSAVMGVLVGLVFLDVRGKGPEQVQYQLSFVFMVIVIAALNANNGRNVQSNQSSQS